MQALKGPLTELAEFEEINKNRMERPRNAVHFGMCKFTKNTYDVRT